MAPHLVSSSSPPLHDAYILTVLWITCRVRYVRSRTRRCNASLWPDTFLCSLCYRDQIGLHSPHRSMRINEWWGLITHSRCGGLYTCTDGDNASCEFIMAAALWAAIISVFMCILFCMAVFVVNWLSLINELARSPWRLRALFGNVVKLRVL